ncbi:MAG: ribonuclease HII [Bacteroidota bacterium]|nr:ribonuclease HII [Bacteroidota bacterium]
MHLSNGTLREENGGQRSTGNMNTFSSFELSFFHEGIRYLAGIDEAGRGPLAGPVVAAAVVIPEGIVIEHVEDSKRLSPAKRARLAREIADHALCVGVGTAGAEEIDALNILRASILAMHRAIDALPIRPDILLVDGNRFDHPTIAFRTVIHGDAQCFSIAAASIVAKVHRDTLMDELDDIYPQYGFRRHRGYPTAAHIEALRLYGPSPVHRKSFTVRALLTQEWKRSRR